MEEQVPLNHLRGKIDEIDDELLRLIQQRVSVSLLLAKLKKENELSIQDEHREHAVEKHWAEVAALNGLSMEDVQAIADRVIKLCREVQFNGHTQKT